MTKLFLEILDISILASWLVLTVFVLRLFFKKAPKWVNVLLWGIVAVRLICPFTIESSISLIPKGIDEGIIETYVGDAYISYDGTDKSQTAVDHDVRPINAGEDGNDIVTAADGVSEPSAFENTWLPRMAFLWCAGMSAMAVYTLATYLHLHKKVATAVRLRDHIYQSEMIATPFVLGVFRPIIYLPFQLNEKEIVHVIAHEQAHLKRMDHWWKPLGFILLTIHWFNPLLWISYGMFCRDLEMACDEKVIKKLEYEERAAYSESLLACSMERKQFAACPLAFGEVSVKKRVKTILNYKKPAFWVIVLAVMACIVMAVCFLTTPPKESEMNPEEISEIQLVPGTTYVSERCIYMNPLSSYFAAGGDSGLKYIVGENSWDTVNRSTGDVSSVPVEKWEWQKFPYTEEEWKQLEFFSLEQFEQILKNAGDILYQPLSDRAFLLKTNSELWLVNLVSNDRMGTYIWDVYSLVSEETKGSVEWIFDPLSSAKLPYFKLSFHMDYEEVSAVCVQSPLVDMESGNSDFEMTISKEKDLYWSPMDGNGQIVTQAEITFFINAEGDTNSHAGKLYITGEETENGKWIYTASLVGGGFYLSQNPEQDGGIIGDILTVSGSNLDSEKKLMAYVQGLEKNILTFDQVEWIDIPSERSQELNITEEEYPSGFAVYNEAVTIEKLSVSEACVCKIFDWTDNYAQKEVTLEELAEILKERGEIGIPYHLTIENHEIVELEEQYIP